MNLWLELGGVLFLAMAAFPWGRCCCNPCPLKANTRFSKVEIFGNVATKYTDATVPNLADGGVFLAIFGASLNNEVWYYDDGAGIQYWFFIRPADSSTCGNTAHFDTYGYDENRFGPGMGGNLNNETYCCEDSFGEGSYVGAGIDVVWEAFR